MADPDRLPDVGLRPVPSPEGLSTLAEAGTYAPRGSRTSDSDPFAVAWVEVDGVAGRLGIAMAPGRHDRVGATSWWRDLHADLRRLRHVHRVHALVTLLTDDELRDLGIANLASALEVHGVESLRLPIRDGGVPTASQADALMALVQAIVRRLRDGRTVVAHCRAGQGRSGLVAAIALAVLGCPPAQAIERVRMAQPRAVETLSQEAYVAEAAAAWARRRLGER
jgi:protein-tyrosine phosphatase